MWYHNYESTELFTMSLLGSFETEVLYLTTWPSHALACVCKDSYLPWKREFLDGHGTLSEKFTQFLVCSH